MPRARSMTLEAVVLRSFDVGDADRFCVLFTKERGRLAVRASGARKTGSRLGPVLLAQRHVRLDVEEHSSGFYVKGGTVLTEPPAVSAQALAVWQEATELTLRLTEDQQEAPELFDHCREFFSAVRSEGALTAFRVQLLSLLGVLPLTPDDPRFAALEPSEQSALRACVRDGETRAVQALDEFVTLVLHEHLHSPLVVPGIRAMMEPQFELVEN